VTAPEDRQRIAPQTGTAFRLPKGALLRVIDVEGEQVSDLVAFSWHDRNEWLSSGRTLDYGSTLFPTTGNQLYSNRSNAMLTIVRDTVGRHDFLLSPCSPEMFERLYGFDRSHPSCFGNLAGSLASFGIEPDRIPTTFNIFMNVDVAPGGELRVLPPLSRAGDSITFRAEMDLLVGLTACSAELSNNWSFKPIDYQVDDCRTPQ
jgi:uncharacterized protein YcgI (DUF1989 family)